MATRKCGQKPDAIVRNLFYGDSWFSTLKTAVGVKELLQSEYLGVVKTSHKHFPKTYLETKMGGWSSGTHLVMETTKNTNKYYAIGYTYSSKKIISFISTSHAGHTNAGEPYVANWVDRNNRRLRRDIPRPHLLSQFFTHSNQIDKHNHARQDLLGIEDNVVTQDGYFRLYYTYLGITVTDAWELYRHHLGDKQKDKNISVMTFSNLLCKTLLVNDYKGAADETSTTPTLRVPEESAPRQTF